MLTRALRVCLDDIIRNFRIRGNSNDSIEFISFINIFVWIAIKKLLVNILGYFFKLLKLSLMLEI